MLIFAHTGITLGASAIIACTVKERRLPLYNRKSWFNALSGYLDIRLLLIGSILPDILDKPLGLLFLRDTLSSGRIYSHTLLFLALITLAGLALYRLRHRTWLLVLASGTLTHLVLDQIWTTPKTMLWPFLGTEFDRIIVSGWMKNILETLRTHPEIYIPEAVGFVVLVWFGLLLIFKKQVVSFIRYGNFH